MRKLIAATVAFCLTIGLAMAAEVTFVKFDKEKKELTVTEDGKEKTYKTGEKVKAEQFEKAKEGKTKLNITVEDGTVTKAEKMGKKTPKP